MISGLSTMLLAPPGIVRRAWRASASVSSGASRSGPKGRSEPEAVEDVLGRLAVAEVLGGELGRTGRSAEDPVEQRSAASRPRKCPGDLVHPGIVALLLLVQIARQVADDGAHDHSFGGASV